MQTLTEAKSRELKSVLFVKMTTDTYTFSRYFFRTSLQAWKIWLRLSMPYHMMVQVA